MLEEMAGAERPLFCFAVTMEAHGPWLEGRLTQEEIARTLQGVDAGLFSPEMRLYLCHLRHMDGLFGMLRGGSLASTLRLGLLNVTPQLFNFPPGLLRRCAPRNDKRLVLLAMAAP
jgi:hypothetical protein